MRVGGEQRASGTFRRGSSADEGVVVSVNPPASPTPLPPAQVIGVVLHTINFFLFLIIFNVDVSVAGEGWPLATVYVQTCGPHQEDVLWDVPRGPRHQLHAAKPASTPARPPARAHHQPARPPARPHAALQVMKTWTAFASLILSLSFVFGNSIRTTCEQGGLRGRRRCCSAVRAVVEGRRCGGGGAAAFVGGKRCCCSTDRELRCAHLPRLPHPLSLPPCLPPCRRERCVPVPGAPLRHWRHAVPGQRPSQGASHAGPGAGQGSRRRRQGSSGSSSGSDGGRSGRWCGGSSTTTVWPCGCQHRGRSCLQLMALDIEACTAHASCLMPAGR